MVNESHPLFELSKRLKRAESKPVSSPNGLANLMSDYDHDGDYWKSIDPKS